MTTNLYPQLEQGATSPTSPSTLQQLLSGVATASRAVMDFFFSEPSLEPVITEHRDRNGETYWEIDDPMARTTIYCFSEAEIMDWLDSYYR